MATLTVTVHAIDFADKTSANWKNCAEFFDIKANEARDYVYSQSLTTKQRSQLLRDIRSAYSDRNCIAPFHNCKDGEKAWERVHQSHLQTLEAWVREYTARNLTGKNHFCKG